MNLQHHIDNLEKLAKRNHDRACAHLADTRLKCNCGVDLHNAKVIGTAIKIAEYLKAEPKTEVLTGEPTKNVTLTTGVKVATPIPGSPALTPPQRIQQSPSVDIPTRTAGPAVPEPEGLVTTAQAMVAMDREMKAEAAQRVQTPQELRAIMESDTPSPAEPSTGTRPLDDIMPGVVMPTPPGSMETHAPPAPAAPERAKRPPVGHGPLTGPSAKARASKMATA